MNYALRAIAERHQVSNCLQRQHAIVFVRRVLKERKKKRRAVVTAIRHTQTHAQTHSQLTDSFDPTGGQRADKERVLQVANERLEKPRNQVRINVGPLLEAQRVACVHAETETRQQHNTTANNAQFRRRATGALRRVTNLRLA